jgi:hypothetical protein
MLVATLALLSLWLAGRFALRRERRAESGIVRTLLAPIGRIIFLPAGTELMAGKKYHFHPSHLHQPARVWVGWWNCGSFGGDSGRYYFFERELRYAIRVDAISTGWGVTMQSILSGALAAIGAMASIGGTLVRRRATSIRKSGRRPDAISEARANRMFAVGLILTMLGLAGLLRL